MNEDIKSLKESIDTLIDENERLRKRIETLEADKKAADTENDAVNAFEKDAAKILEKLLKDYKPVCPGAYYTPDDLDWSYKPSRTVKPFEVGDWPPGPQIGDAPALPDDYPYYPYYPYGPYWSIFPPYWTAPRRYTVVSNIDPVNSRSSTIPKNRES